MSIITLYHKDYIAKINASAGANCISLINTRHNCRILREPNYMLGIDNPYLYGMPLLFPVNRISNGSFTFEGRKYQFPINEPSTGCFLHGTLHETAFDIIEQNQSSVLLSYKATKDVPYLTFPHEFVIKIKYSLDDAGLLQEVIIQNLSSQNMPVFLGFHTTFNIPFIDGTQRSTQRIKVECSEEYERDMSTFLPTGKILPFDDSSHQLDNGTFVLNQPISRHYRSGKDGTISITDASLGLSVIYETCPDFAYRLIYSNCPDYICLEPQTCIVNCINAPFNLDETGFQFIKPRAEKRYWSRIYITQKQSP